MRGGVSAAWAAIAMLGCAGAAGAADLATKAPLYTKAPEGPSSCGDVEAFFLTDCQLAWYGVRFYGTIDVGGGYQSNGAPIGRFTSTGLSYLPQKMNNGGKWLFNQSALSSNIIGFQVKEPLADGWSFVGQVETAFNPSSLDLTSGPGAIRDVIGKPLGSAPGASDSSVAGQFYNSLGFVGISSDTWGTLTFLRQKNLLNEAFGSFDAIPGSNAFSLIGGSGAYSGGGNTENVRATTAVKYRVNFANYHLGLFGQFGGYDQGNGAKGAFQGELGADYHVGPGVLAADVVGGYTKDAINEGIVAGTLASGAGDPNSQITGLKATISDNTFVSVMAKYTIDKLKLYAGYEWVQFAPPSDPSTAPFTDTAGIQFGTAPFAISTTDYNNGNKVWNVVWTGARYSVTSSVDVAAAYYHVDQNNYNSANFSACAVSSLSKSSCSGTEDVASAMIDWKFAAKWDTYLGVQYAKLNGGLANGYVADNFVVTSAGVRFRW